MASLTARLAAAAATAATVGLLLLAERVRNAPAPPVALRIGDTAAGGELDGSGPEPSSARTAEPGASVLELEHPRHPRSTFVREPWREQRFAEERDSTMPDPFVHYRYRPGVVRRHPWPEHPEGEWTLRTNSLGMREDDEPAARQPDLRVLVAGDSHTDGVCDNDESFANLLEARLAEERAGETVEVLNAGRGGYGFYQYLGTLERFLDLRPDVLVVAVYGGNDFDNVLTPYHRYNGTTRPPGSALYRDALAGILEREELQPPLAQGLSACKYFDLHPGEMETALQAARDVTTEILVTCLRHGVHPIFVYLPTLAGTEWDSDAEVLDELVELLELSADGLASVDRLADSYLDFLRQRRVDVIDLRETFARAGPGNYWLRDHHVGWRGHALIAEELAPLVAAAVPAGSRRARVAPGSTGPDDPAALLSPGSPLEGELAPPDEASTSGLVGVAHYDEPTSRELFGRPPGTVHDPLAGLAWAPDLRVDGTKLGLERSFPFATDARGLRRHGDASAGANFRVVLAGDEQAVGACEAEATLAGRLARELQRLRPDRPVEVIDAAVTGHGPHNWSGVYERSRALTHEVFVLAVSSGSDFLDVLRVDALLDGRPPGRNLEDYAPALERARALAPGAVARSLASTKFFLEHRPRGNRAFELALEAVLELRRRCQQDGVTLVVLHVPDPLAIEWPRHAGALEDARTALGLEPGRLDTNARIAAPWLDELERRGVTVVRLERAFEGAPEPLYAPVDLVLDGAGSARAAELLAAELGGASR